MEIRKLEGWGALVGKYPRQIEAQDCYVSLDLQRGILTADYNPEIGNAIPMVVYHGHVRRYPIPRLTNEAANDLLEELAPLAERVIAGYESVWDGHNQVASLSPDAIAAQDDIRDICNGAFASADEGDTISVVATEDWLYAIKGDMAEKSDEELKGITAELEADARSQNLYLDGDVEEILRRWKDEFREEETGE